MRDSKRCAASRIPLEEPLIPRARTFLWLPIVVALALVFAACGGDDDGSPAAAAGGASPNAGRTVNLVAYSTPQEAYAAIKKAFDKTDAGKGVKFTESYGASGDQSRAVEAGQKAD